MLPIQPPCNYISYHQPDRSPKAQNGEQKVRSQIRKREQASGQLHQSDDLRETAL